MTDAARLAVAIDEFDRTLAELGRVMTRTDSERLYDMTKLRRKLSEHIGFMRDIGANAFPDAALADEFRSRLSKLLSVISMHQANWPAVSIDRGGVAYRESSAATGAANRAFIEWTRTTLARARAAH